MPIDTIVRPTLITSDPSIPAMWPGLEELLATGARKGSILLVDDLQGVREILCWVLEREGYLCARVQRVQCLRAALTQRPDLILLNYLMPVMDGLTALRQIKINPVTSYLKVVMFSGVGDESPFWSAAAEAGALDCLHTPFIVKTLLSTVEKALRS